MQPAHLEDAALNAWPALQQLRYDGWLLRFSHGYTKRANSVHPLAPGSFPLEEKVSACEAWYAAKGLRAVFRLTPAAGADALDVHLASRGYASVEPSRVMHLSLPGASRGRIEGELREEPLNDWIELYRRFRGLSGEQEPVLRAMLNAIWPERLLVSLSSGGGVVACGMAVMERELVGLFDLVTDPRRRNRGHGRSLVTGVLEAAGARGARRAYLQVTAYNRSACHLYEALGFRTAYEYAYRVAPGP